MRGKCSQDLSCLLVGDLEDAKRSAKFCGNFIELRGRNLELAVGDFQANGSAARFCGGILEGAAGDIADP